MFKGKSLKRLLKTGLALTVLVGTMAGMTTQVMATTYDSGYFGFANGSFRVDSQESIRNDATELVVGDVLSKGMIWNELRGSDAQVYITGGLGLDGGKLLSNYKVYEFKDGGKTMYIVEPVTPAPCKPQGKTDAQRAEEKKQVEAMNAAYAAYFAANPEIMNNISELYAVNPGLGLDAALIYTANITIDEYNAQMEAYFAQYAEQMALYEAMMNAQNAQ